MDEKWDGRTRGTEEDPKTWGPSTWKAAGHLSSEEVDGWRWTVDSWKGMDQSGLRKAINPDVSVQCFNLQILATYSKML